MPNARPPDLDLVIAFRATKGTTISKQTREDARKAEQQYKRLVGTLTDAGLKAVGRRGESLGHILVFVLCPPKLVEDLVRRERHSDFLEGLPVPQAKSILTLSPAERIRLVHSYVSSTPADGGLGISPDSPGWDCTESIFPIHDRHFNEAWVRVWKPRTIASVQLEKIRDQFGDSLAYYFAFLASYTHSLVAPAVLGIFAHFFLPPYSPIYSILLCLWSITFVEWWRVHERILSLRFGTRGSFKVEKRRPQYKSSMTWWAQELRILVTIPIILMWAGILAALMTSIFVFEAFITRLYQGPGKQVVAFSPTILFVVLLPKFLAAYHSIAVRLTNWENHAVQSTYNASLTLKTFALGAIVAYLALGLSAFVYVPFGEDVMLWVQTWLFSGFNAPGTIGAAIHDLLNGTISAFRVKQPNVQGAGPEKRPLLWDIDTTNVRGKLNPSRLREQMFAYAVTNQVVNSFLEIGLPFILRWAAGFMNKKNQPSHPKASGSPDSSGDSSAVNTPRKRVVFEDEKERGGLEERVFLDKVRSEAALPAYDLFVDYNEMVVQFGYVVVWSSIWPLAGAVSLLNNLLELRSDAFKMTVHHRRPIPTRADTIGPWLDALTLLTWFGAMMNAALVYLFSPQILNHTPAASVTSNKVSEAVASIIADNTHIIQQLTSTSSPNILGSASFLSKKQLLLKAALVALLASHGFILTRLVIRHIVEKAYWCCSKELAMRDKVIRQAREGELKGMPIGAAAIEVEKVIIKREVIPSSRQDSDGEGNGELDEMRFWDEDEGIEEIRRILKEA